MVGTLAMTQTKFTRGQRVSVAIGASAGIISPVTKEPQLTAIAYVRYVAQVVPESTPFVSVRIELEGGTKGPVRMVHPAYVEDATIEEAAEYDNEGNVINMNADGMYTPTPHI